MCKFETSGFQYPSGLGAAGALAIALRGRANNCFATLGLPGACLLRLLLGVRLAGVLAGLVTLAGLTGVGVSNSSTVGVGGAGEGATSDLVCLAGVRQTCVASNSASDKTSRSSALED